MKLPSQSPLVEVVDLAASVLTTGLPPWATTPDGVSTYHGLNEMLVGRGLPPVGESQRKG